MPPRALRGTPASSSAAPHPGSDSEEPVAHRSQGSLSPAPSRTPTPRPAQVSLEVEAGIREEMDPLPPASASDVAPLNQIVATLQSQIEDMQRERPIRAVRQGTEESERPFRETSEAVTEYASDGSRNKIKASDLLKFGGKDHEDVDRWIEKVNAIYGYSGIRDSDLLQQLPMVLQGNAQTWFVGLGKRRHRLHNWSDWQQAI